MKPVYVLVFFVMIFMVATSSYAAPGCEADRQLWQEQSHTDDCPDDIKRFFERLNLCGHFAGEVGDTDPERTKFLKGKFEELRCNQLACDYQELLQAYKTDQALAKVLTEQTSFVFDTILGEALLCERQ